MSSFAALDPLLPPTVDAGEGERLTARRPDGRTAEGVLYRARYDGWESVWHARRTWELTPCSPAVGADGVGALLRLVRTRLDREPQPADSALAVTWPSRDMAVSRELLAHGLAPRAVLAVREARAARTKRSDGSDAAPGSTVRRAGASELTELVHLAREEMRYASHVGSAVPRDGVDGWLRTELAHALAADEPVWLAESDGLPLGMAACRRPATDLRRLPRGRWAGVGTVSVTAPARGTGVGRALLATAHRELLAGGAHGTFLFYSPNNALSSVFWHRQGYRPLWTTWEVRPAIALRE